MKIYILLTFGMNTFVSGNVDKYKNVLTIKGRDLLIAEDNFYKYHFGYDSKDQTSYVQ